MSELNQPLLGGKPFVKKKRKHNRKLKTSHRKTCRKIKSRHVGGGRLKTLKKAVGAYLIKHNNAISGTKKCVAVIGFFTALFDMMLLFAVSATASALISIAIVLIAGLTLYLKWRKLDLEKNIVKYQKFKILFKQIQRLIINGGARGSHMTNPRDPSSLRTVLNDAASAIRLKLFNEVNIDMGKIDRIITSLFGKVALDNIPDYTELLYMLEEKRKESLEKMKNLLFTKMNIVKSDFYIGLGNLIVALGEIVVAHLGIAGVSATAATVGITATTTMLALPALLPLCMLIFICLNGVIKDKFYTDHEKKVTGILTRVHKLAKKNGIRTKFYAAVFNGESNPLTQTFNFTINDNTPIPVILTSDMDIDLCVFEMNTQLSQYAKVIKTRENYILVSNHAETDNISVSVSSHTETDNISVTSEEDYKVLKLHGKALGQEEFDQGSDDVKDDAKDDDEDDVKDEDDDSNSIMRSFYDLYLDLLNSTPLTIYLHDDLDILLEDAEKNKVKAEAEASAATDAAAAAATDAEAAAATEAATVAKAAAKAAAAVYLTELTQVLQYLIIKLDEAKHICDNKGLDGDTFDDLSGFGGIGMGGGEHPNTPPAPVIPTSQDALSHAVWQKMQNIFKLDKNNAHMFEPLIETLISSDGGSESVVDRLLREKFKPVKLIKGLLSAIHDTPLSQKLNSLLDSLSVKQATRLSKNLKSLGRRLSKKGGYSNKKKNRHKTYKKKKKHNKTKRKHN